MQRSKHFGPSSFSPFWIKRHAPALTTNISLAHLLAAYDGGAIKPMHPGLSGILDGNCDDEIEVALAGLSAVGHSSGWDAFSGVLAVAKSWQRKPCGDPHRDRAYEKRGCFYFPRIWGENKCVPFF